MQEESELCGFGAKVGGTAADVIALNPPPKGITSFPVWSPFPIYYMCIYISLVNSASSTLMPP